MPTVSRSALLVSLGFALLLCCGLITGGLLTQQESSNRWIRHTFTVQAHLAQERILGLQAENARRGFLLNGDPGSRARSAQARRAAQRELASLVSLTADNSRQRRNLAALSTLIDARFRDMAASFDLADAGRIGEARREMASADHRRTTDALLQALDRVGQEEATLLRQRIAQSHDQARRAQQVLIITALLVLLVAALVWRDRVQRLRERRVMEGQLRLLATNATDAVFRLSLNARFLYASPSTQRVFGVEPASIVGQSLYYGVYPEDRALLAESLDLILTGAREQLLITYRTLAPEQESGWRWVESNVAGVRDGEGRLIEIISAVRDVTARKAMEFELDAARARAVEAAAAKSTFLANMSHEIRTPMNGVIGFTELLLAGELADDQRRQAELIADSGRAMMRLLNDILDLSKVDAGQMQITHEPFDLRHALKSCGRLILPAVEQRGLALQVEVDAALPRLICGDGLRLRQIVLNLLGNAAKFTLTGTITLQARAAGTPAARTIEIDVEDTGIGIPADRQAAVFDAFVQADAGTAGRFGGTGLGLPISARLATLMGGDLTMESTPGVGTRFRLRLPLVAGDHGHCAASLAQHQSMTDDAASGDGDGDGRRVLVAEDHDVNQLLITAMLRRLGCEVDIAADGERAVAMVEAARAEQAPYALVFMDMQMPVMDGPTAARRLRGAGIAAGELPIVALTANAYADDVSACLAAGMQAHLAKPVTLADLDRALAHWGGSQADGAAPAPTPALPASAGSTVGERYRIRRQEALDAVAALLRQGTFVETELATVEAHLHKLAGTAAMFGEAELGDRARHLEAELASDDHVDKAARIRTGAAMLLDAA